ncbi:MAG: hypothetical protein JW895_17700 [Thermoleophilaceae bacterium]|nr:hypothetical protein [Thermoleophilaceae bacterium]
MPSPSPYRGAAVRVLRWLPLLAGLIAVDRIDGVKGLVIGLVVAIDVAAVSVTCHNRLTRSVDGPVGEPTWLEAILVWLNVTLLLAIQVALGDPGGTPGRIAAVLSGLVLGALASELAAGRRAPAFPR